MSPDPQARHTLLALAAILAATWVLSDAVLRYNPAFWRWAAAESQTATTRPLGIEARLRTLAPGQAEVVVIGSSVVTYDVHRPLLLRRLRVPGERLALLALPGATAQELSMLAPRLADLRPQLVVWLTTPYTLHEDAGDDRLRLYDPRVALALWGWQGLLADHQRQASLLMGWSHTLIGQRDRLRRLLFRPWFGPSEDPQALENAEIRGRLPGMAVRREARAATLRAANACPNAQTRAVAATARRLGAAGVPLLAVATPLNNTWERDPALRRQLDECLAAAAATAGFAVVPKADLPVFGPEAFRDAAHLTDAAAARFTAAWLPAAQAALRGGASRGSR